jgi:aldehyde dehydrogenase family 7 protein A1
MLLKAYPTIKIGNPLDSSTLCGPLHNKAAVKEYTDAVEEITKAGGKLLIGGKPIEGKGNYVEPTIFEIDGRLPVVKTEFFVPILHLIKCKDIDEAIELNNMVP